MKNEIRMKALEEAPHWDWYVDREKGIVLSIPCAKFKRNGSESSGKESDRRFVHRFVEIPADEFIETAEYCMELIRRIRANRMVTGGYLDIRDNMRIVMKKHGYDERLSPRLVIIEPDFSRSESNSLHEFESTEVTESLLASVKRQVEVLRNRITIV